MSNLNISLVIRAFNRAKGPTREAANDVDYLARRTRLAQQLGTGLGRAFSLAAGGITAALSAMGFGAIRTSAKFERFESILTTIEGSAERARRSMSWVTTFAAKTPYEVDQVMEAFVRLKAYGVDPADGSLRTLGDTASAMGKDVMAAVEMLADAQTGEFERLKEFGVRAKAQGNQVAFTYERAGKVITVTAKKNSAEIRKALLGIFDSRFAGAMDRQSRTFDGFLSNLGDWWTKFQLKIGEKGAFDTAKGILSGWLDQLQRAEQDGSLDRWASKISTALGSMMTTVAGVLTSIDWPKFITGIGSVVEGLATFVGMIGGLQGILDLGVAAMIGGLTIQLAGLGAVLTTTGGALALTPWGWFVGAVAAVAGIAYIVIRNWGPISGFFKNLWSGIVQATAPAVRFLTALFLNFTPVGLVIRHWRPLTQFFRGLWRSIRGIFTGETRGVLSTLAGFTPLGFLVRNWGQLREFFAGVWNAAASVTVAAFRILRAVIMEFTPIGVVVRNWGPISRFFSSLWRNVGAIVRAGARAAVAAVAMASPVGIIVRNWAPVSRVIGGVWARVRGVIGPALSWIWTQLKAHTPLGIIAANWEPLVGFFRRLWGRIEGVFSSSIGRISGWLKNLNPTRILDGLNLRGFVERSEARTAAARGGRGPAGAPAAPTSRGAAAPGRTRLDGTVDVRVRVEGEGGARARVRSVRTTGDNLRAAAYRGAAGGSRR